MYDEGATGPTQYLAVSGPTSAQNAAKDTTRPAPIPARCPPRATAQANASHMPFAARNNTYTQYHDRTLATSGTAPDRPPPPPPPPLPASSKRSKVSV